MHLSGVWRTPGSAVNRRSYDNLPPNGDSLKMTAARTLTYFTERIVPYLQSRESALVHVHGNSLLPIIMHIEQLNHRCKSSITRWLGGW